MTWELLPWRCIIRFDMGVVGSAFSISMRSELPCEILASSFAKLGMIYMGFS